MQFIGDKTNYDAGYIYIKLYKIYNHKIPVLGQRHTMWKAN